MVKIQFVGSDGKYIESGVCSGSLVAPNVVLTAGHCVAPVLSQNWRVYISVGDGNSIVQVEDGSGHLPPGYDPMSDTPDVGVYVTRNAMCPKPLPFASAVDATLVGAPLRYVGFGRTVADLALVPAKRTVSSTISAVGSEFIESDDADHGVCNGDSGGALLVELDGVETLAGVISRGLPGCTPSFYSERVDVNLPFVQPFIDNAAAPAPPCATDSGGGCAVGGFAGDPRAILFLGLLLVAIAKRRTA